MNNISITKEQQELLLDIINDKFNKCHDSLLRNVREASQEDYANLIKDKDDYFFDGVQCTLGDIKNDHHRLAVLRDIFKGGK